VWSPPHDVWSPQKYNTQCHKDKCPSYLCLMIYCVLRSVTSVYWRLLVLKS